MIPDSNKSIHTSTIILKRRQYPLRKADAHGQAVFHGGCCRCRGVQRCQILFPGIQAGHRDRPRRIPEEISYGCYAGDNLNFDKAAEELEKEGIPTRTVRVWDDIASAPRERITDRRGIAGDVLMLKIAGAACGALPLEEAYRVSVKARDNLYSIGVGLEGATIPGQKEPIFSLPADEMEYGLGIHGEPGIRRIKMQTADEIVTELVAAILEESGIQAGDTVCTYVNGLGSTTLMELMIMNRKLKLLLEEKGILIHDMDVNSLVTTMEMAGASISIMKMDQELLHYYDMPCRSPYYTKA